MALQKKVKKTRKIKEREIDLDHDEPTQEEIEKAFELLNREDDDDYFPEEDL